MKDKPQLIIKPKLKTERRLIQITALAAFILIAYITLNLITI